jgi:cbb3-type cytochrome oxidase subunit 3
MHDAYFWIAFFGAPLFFLLVTAFVFRPSAREQYREAKQVIFAEERAARRRGSRQPPPALRIFPTAVIHNPLNRVEPAAVNRCENRDCLSDAPRAPNQVTRCGGFKHLN